MGVRLNYETVYRKNGSRSKGARLQNCQGKTGSFDTTFWNRRNGIALVRQAGAGNVGLF